MTLRILHQSSSQAGYRQVWHKLTVGLGTLPVANPSDNALWQARARLGAAPLRWLTCIGWALQVIPAERLRCLGEGLRACAGVGPRYPHPNDRGR